MTFSLSHPGKDGLEKPFSFAFHGCPNAQLRHKCIAEARCRDYVTMTKRAYSRHLTVVHGWIVNDERRTNLLVEWMNIRSLKD